MLPKKQELNAMLQIKPNCRFPLNQHLCLKNQAQFHPLKFLSEIADDLEIYENTKAICVKNNTVITDKGNIKAENIVFACHFPFVNFPGLYFLKLNQERSYVVSAKQTKSPSGMYIDAEDGLSSLLSK